VRILAQKWFPWLSYHLIAKVVNIGVERDYFIIREACWSLEVDASGGDTIEYQESGAFWQFFPPNPNKNKMAV